MYDLTVDYDFDRMPRNHGNAQLPNDRINEVGCWNEVATAFHGDEQRETHACEIKKTFKQNFDNVYGQDRRREVELPRAKSSDAISVWESS
ncbi:hypothetical protein CKAH01_12437 [Colletotrichum kahawae]|uniref:Uncharacterized protein n=1 Tax=Colletotrichum kahawae TaxID=34407 RepID=A0AAD9YTG2_COLKA|nr:hypothetical protein CKAH01_12437 [Colletotrichum kahawae]